MVNEALNRVVRGPATHGERQAAVRSGSSARTGAPDRRRRERSAANSLSAARSLIGSFHPSSVRQRSERADQRAHPRRASRLRSAKLLDGVYRFVCEGRICDRSREGLRLALCPRHCASAAIGGAHRRNIRSARGQSDLAARVDNRTSTAGAAPGRRAAAKPKVRAQGTLLRDSGLSLFTHSSSPRPEPSRRAC